MDTSTPGPLGLLGQKWELQGSGFHIHSSVGSCPPHSPSAHTIPHCPNDPPLPTHLLCCLRMPSWGWPCLKTMHTLLLCCEV